jgi:hypothetical protein
MSFRDDLKPCLDDIQAIAGPDCLDVRTNRVFVVVRQYTKGYDLGTQQDCAVEILPRPMVRERNRGRELIVKPVPQKYVDVATGAETLRSGGFDADTLNPEDVERTAILFRVEGPNAGEYTLADYSAGRPFRQVLVLKRIPASTGLRMAHPQPHGTTNDPH